MLKKRIIFTLLYDNNNFILSRNFRIQKVGDINWLRSNYNFSKISFFIDELVVIDITRDKQNIDLFCENLKLITNESFVPVTAGGGIRNINQALDLLNSGADKIIINTPIFHEIELVSELVKSFGRQCVVGSFDCKKNDQNDYDLYYESGRKKFELSLKEFSEIYNFNLIGELYLNSIDRDGTGQGYDFNLLDCISNKCNIPLILAGGAGNSSHLLNGLLDKRVDAVATAHLFNFIGDGLKKARSNVLKSNINLAKWISLEELDKSET